MRLLLADIGNTCIKIGIATRDGVEATYSLPSRIPHTADSLGLDVLNLLRHHASTQSAGITEPNAITDCAVCSVVPDATNIFIHACERFLRITPRLFPADFSLNLENHYKRPEDVGADRLLAAFAARTLYPEPKSIISVDFGTATTFDCVSGNAYLGGLICPGVLSSHSALASGTAKLPRISLEVMDHAPLVGDSTPTSMSHGFVFGFAAMTEGLCRRLKEQLPGPVVVVGTGGFAPEIARVCDSFDYLRPDLILEGLRMAFFGGAAPKPKPCKGR